MEHTDVLRTMAEVAAGFAGFTAILLAVLSRDAPLHNIRTGIIHFLQLSLSVVLLALMPDVLSSLLLAETSIWRISNAVQGLCHFYLLWWIMSRRSVSPGHTQMGSSVTLVLAACGALVASLNICVAIGLFPRVLVFSFLFGLIWYLAMALVNFVSILLYRLKLE